MPFYTYKCPACALVFSAVMPIALRRTVRCVKCRILGEIQIQPTAVRTDIAEAFESPATGKWITSRAQLNEDLQRSGCHIWEAGEQKDTARRRQELAAQEDQRIEQAVRETAAGLGL